MLEKTDGGEGKVKQLYRERKYRIMFHKKTKAISFICGVAMIYVTVLSGCAAGTDDTESATPLPETTILTVSSLLGIETSSEPEETEPVSSLQGNLDECAAFRAEIAEKIENDPKYFTHHNKLFSVAEFNDPATDTPDGYFCASITRTEGTADWEALYIPAEFDQYPVLSITYTTVSLYIPDGPVFCLKGETPGLELEEDEQTGDTVGAISGWDVRYPVQPEGEYAMFIYQDETLKYGIKIWTANEKLTLAERNESDMPLREYLSFGCEDRQFIYTFKILSSGVRNLKLIHFAGDLTEDVISDESKAY